MTIHKQNLHGVCSAVHLYNLPCPDIGDIVPDRTPGFGFKICFAVADQVKAMEKLGFTVIAKYGSGGRVKVMAKGGDVKKRNIEAKPANKG